MVAKRSSRALAVLLALPSAAFAVGLGDIHLLSPLNAPLDAEIDLVDVTPEEMSTLQVQLASRDTFAQNGLDYPNYLSGVKVKTVRTPDGREVIKLKSNDVVSDPFLTVLVEVNWARGRLVREYTVLLDPPVFAPGQSQVAAAPVAAPTTGAGAREGTIARNEAPPAPAPAPAPAESAAALPPATPPPAPEPVAAAAAAPTETAPTASAAATAAAATAATAAAAEMPSAAPAASTPPPSPGMAEAAPSAAESTSAETPATPSATETSASTAAPAAAASGDAEASTHVVHRGETLSQIAAGAAGAKVSSAHARSWMLAIYQANPRAFEKNMNLLRSGAVLRMPDAATVAAVSPAEASSEIRRQYAEWHGAPASRGEAALAAPSEATAAAQQPARLKLVTPSESASVGTTPGAKSGEVAALQGRVHDLEGQLAESKRLLQLKDADLAHLQSQLAAKQAPAPAPAPQAAPPAPAVAPPAAAPPVASAPVPAESPPVAQNTPAPPPAPAVEEKPQPAAEMPPVAAKRPPAPAHKAEPPASSGGLIDTLLGFWWVLLLGLVAVGAIFGLRMLKARRAAQFGDSLDRLAGTGNDPEPDLGNLGGTGTFRGFGANEPPMPAARAKPAARAEAAFVVEETASHERPRQAPGAPAPAPSPRHVASDETISSETAINLDQGDPLAEADFHMAYGLYDQAADLIRIAITREPTRRDLKLKLLEVFFVWGNKDQFLQTARELAETRADAAPGEWEKILIMGKQLAPEDPLFSGGGAVTGAAAGGVDLDLEGGQSRVDFDLLGEPGATGEAPHGVDLDIGTAVSEGLGTDSATGATDRNVALLENSFVAATGTTRQMTARMRQNGTGTAEIEGPTVEQPALTARDNPTIRAKLETAMRKGAGADQTAELAIDDLGLDVGSLDTVDQPGIAAAASSTPDAPTLVAGLDERSRRVIEDAHRSAKDEVGNTTGAWQFDQNELEAALTQTSLAVPDPSSTSRLAALRGHGIDVDVGDITGTHAATAPDVDVDVGTATGTHAANGRALDLDVGTATVPDTAFAATQRLTSDELALPDLEPVTMSEVGTKLDLARAYMDMGDPDGARNILEEVLSEGSAAQKQEAQRLMESLP